MKAFGMFLLIAVGAAACIASGFGINWLLWKTWLYVVPSVWATGPENIIHPSWLMFFLGFVVVSFVGRSIFGGWR